MIRDVVTMSLNKKESSQNNNAQSGANELPRLAAPLNDQQLGHLQQTVSELSSRQLAWVMVTYGAGARLNLCGAAAPITQAAAAVAAKPAGKLSIIFASQTGNAKGVAESLEAEAKALGIAVELFDEVITKGKNSSLKRRTSFSWLQLMVRVKRQITRLRCTNSYTKER